MPEKASRVSGQAQKNYSLSGCTNCCFSREISEAFFWKYGTFVFSFLKCYFHVVFFHCSV